MLQHVTQEDWPGAAEVAYLEANGVRDFDVPIVEISRKSQKLHASAVPDAVEV
jgi:hypothetical protein